MNRNPIQEIMMKSHFKKFCGMLCIALMFSIAPALAAPQHPMDPLTADEYRQVKSILEKEGLADGSTRYPLVTLLELPKSEVREWRPGKPFSRSARIVARKGAQVFKAVVDLSGGKLASWQEVKDKQSSIMFGEWAEAQELALADSEMQARLKSRGITDLEKIYCPPASQGYFGQAEEEGKRLFKVYCIDLRPAGNNYYGWPIEGLYAVVDLKGKSVTVFDSGEIPISPANLNFSESDVSSLRPPLKPVKITQPKGTNYRINGNIVEWQKWRFHLRMNRRLGMVLSNVTYEDGGEARSVLYQGYMSEMFVPYNDPDFGWFSRTYFDVGEYGSGLLASALVPGVDCPEAATFISSLINDDEGNPLELPNTICIFERNTGNPSWRHAEFLNETYEGRPQVELVARMAPQVGNYDYIIDWVFNQSGELDGRVAATGIDALKGVRAKTMDSPTAKEDAAFGTLIAPNLVATYHDHHFNFRLDFDIDGARNHFIRSTYDVVKLPEDHPRGYIYAIRDDVPTSESQGQYSGGRKIERYRIASSTRKNYLANPTSYEILLHGRARYILPQSEWYSKRAGFLRNNIWVTPHHPDERYGSGEFVFASKGDDGLAVWTKQNRSIKDEDIVVWVNIGMNHFTRSEDTPVLPTFWRSFTLRPFNFFDRNPAIDLRTQFAE